jgi:hypothetical protein
VSAMSDVALFVETAHTQALETLLWSEIISIPEEEQNEPKWGDQDGRPFDDLYDVTDLAGETETFLSQVSDFVTANWDDVKGMDPTDVGHNFVLSRNHHGTGFWDRGLGDLGDRLHKACEPYGDVNLMLGDDSKVYLSA